jgi:arsenite-transporting ATPase
MGRDDFVHEDAILNELLYIKDRIQKSSRILTEWEKTAFFFVVVPESMIIKDTLKAADLFAKFKVPISGYVVNRVLPESLKTESIPEYLKHRLDMQGNYLEEIRHSFGNQVLAQVPEMERDITGLPMIARMAELLCG